MRQWNFNWSKNIRYVQNLSATFLSQLISALSILVLSPILLERLGEEGFSAYGVILNLVVFAGIFDFGMNLGLLKKIIHQFQASQALVNSVLLFFAFFWVLTAPLVFCSFQLGWVKIPNPYGLYALLTALLISQNLVAALLDVVIQSTNKIYLGKAIRVIKLLADFGLIFFLSKTQGIAVLLGVSAGVNLVYIGLLLFFAQREFPFPLCFRLFSWSLLAQHFKYSFWYFLTTVSGMLVFNSQVFLLNSLLGAAAVAKYLMATRFFEIIRMGISNFTAILIPQLALLQEEGQWHTLRQYFLHSMTRVTLISFVVFCTVYYFGQPYFLLWSKFSDAEMVTLFQVFTVFMFLIAVDNVSANYISALKWNQLPTLVAVFQGILGLFLGWMLLEGHGILGMAWGSVIALLLTNLIFNPWYILKRLQLHIKGSKA